MKQNKTIGMAVKVAGLALLVGGCQADKSGMTEFFPSDEGRATQNFMTAQAAAGARADATLQPMHFDGEKLNSLGQAKLDLMLKDDDTAEPLVVYMNLGEKDETLKGRRDAVTSYLEDCGVNKDGIEFKMGTNPHMTGLVIERVQAPTAGNAPNSTPTSGAPMK